MKTQKPNDAIAKILASISKEEQKITDQRMRIACLIGDALEKRGWTIAQFANQMNTTGERAAAWLSGEQTPSTATLFKIECLLGVSIFRRPKHKTLGNGRYALA